jgi:hypothetical protein
MTEHDLSTLVRDHVSSDEPPFAGPEGVIARGRRTVRTRRITAGVGVAAVLAVAGGLVVPRISGSDDGGDSTAIDPAIQRALDHYDAKAMPRILEDAAREALSPSVPDLGPVKFVAFSDDGLELDAGDYDRAGGMDVRFGGAQHSWSVELLHAGGEVDAPDKEAQCAADLRAGYYLACDVMALPDGDVAVTRVTALYKAGPEWGWGALTSDEIALVPSDILWFERETEVMKSDTFLTRVNERVKAPSLAAAEDAFAVPVADQIALGSDPQLVIPVPDDNGDGISPALPATPASPLQ